jgi:hypothetical protein
MPWKSDIYNHLTYLGLTIPKTEPISQFLDVTILDPPSWLSGDIQANGINVVALPCLVRLMLRDFTIREITYMLGQRPFEFQLYSVQISIKAESPLRSFAQFIPLLPPGILSRLQLMQRLELLGSDTSTI